MSRFLKYVDFLARRTSTIASMLLLLQYINIEQAIALMLLEVLYRIEMIQRGKEK